MNSKNQSRENARQGKSKNAHNKNKILLWLVLAGAASMQIENASAQCTPPPSNNEIERGVIGWDGDRNGVVAHLNGGYHIRLYTDHGPCGVSPAPTATPNPGIVDVSFGIYSNPSPPPIGTVNWYNKEGYLPCLVTEFVRDGCIITISNFGDLLEFPQPTPQPARRFVAVYTRVQISNLTPFQHGPFCPAPTVSPSSLASSLVTLPGFYNKGCMVPGNSTISYDYVIAVDRFGHDEYPWPTAAELVSQGGWGQHYLHMKNYWNDRLSEITDIVHLPDVPAQLVNAYKAGYIYTNIVKDGGELKVGEERYDEHPLYELFENDKLEIIAALITIGDPNALKYLEAFPTSGFTNAYIMAKWKCPWLWALYLQRTSDTSPVQGHLTEIKALAHEIQDLDRCLGQTGCPAPPRGTNPNRLIRPTFLWNPSFPEYLSVDNWAALTGLASYKYICDQLPSEPACIGTGPTPVPESTWANGVYVDLLNAVNDVHANTMSFYNPPLNYLPVDMYWSNSSTNPLILHNPNDANWAITLGFGHWAWDASLLGASQYGVELDTLDNTYTAGFQALQGLFQHNFGGYIIWPYPRYSSVYNAGYGNAGLRSENYRSEGVYSYQFMIDYGQSGPFSWFESFAAPAPSRWAGTHPVGSAFFETEQLPSPHITGQAQATKVLIDSLIALRGDGAVVIGRGVPNLWVTPNQQIELARYPITNGNKMGFTLNTDAVGEIHLALTGPDNPTGGTVLDLRVLKNNIRGVTAGSYNQSAGTVTLAQGVTGTIASLITLDPPPHLALLEAESANLKGCYSQSDVHASGGFTVGGIDAVGDSVEFSNVPSGEHLVIGYSALNDATLSLYVNDLFQTQVSFYLQGGTTCPCATVDIPVDIQQGDTVKLQFDRGDDPVTLDYMQLYTRFD